jgi:hypothetical protein
MTDQSPSFLLKIAETDHKISVTAKRELNTATVRKKGREMDYFLVPETPRQENCLLETARQENCMLETAKHENNLLGTTRYQYYLLVMYYNNTVC